MKIAFLHLALLVLMLNLSDAFSEPLDVSISDASLLDFHLSEKIPKVGRPLVIYVQELSSIEGSETLLAAYLNGSSVNLVKSPGALWVLDLGIQNRVQENILEVRVSTRNAKESSRLSLALSAAEKKIEELTTKIAQESDPAKLAELQALLAEQNSAKNQISQELDALTIFLKSERLVFSTEGDPQNEAFPRIIRVTPGVGTEAGGQANRIVGRNFTAAPSVRIGGVAATVISSTDTEIRIVSPAQSGLGSRDVDVSFTSTGKNAAHKAGYFVTTPVLLKNVRPVAATVGHLEMSKSATPTLALSGASAYDENSDSMTYSWKVSKSPANSTFLPGSVWRTSRNPNFSPDKVGVYVFEFRAKEAATVDQLESFPISVTIEVNQ